MPNHRQQKPTALQSNLQNVLAQFGMVAGKDYQNTTLQDVAPIEDYYPETQSSSSQKTNNSTATAQGILTEGDPIGEAPSERLMYYYHPDYLGNVEYITDMDVLPYQYFWYSPWGEALKDQKANTNTWETSYQFNGKELDDETGLYYYGARYYNPQVSVWLSVDPLADRYPSMSSYCFTANNPVMLIDPDGRRIVWSFAAARIGLSMMFSKNGRENWRTMRNDKFVDFKFRLSSSVGMSRDKSTGEWSVVEGHTYKESGSECTMVMTIYTGSHKLKKEAEKRHDKDWHEIPKDLQYSTINAKVKNKERDIELIEDSGENTGRIYKMDDSYSREDYMTSTEQGYENTSHQGESKFQFIGRLGKHESTHGLINSGIWKDPYPQEPEKFPQEREF